MARDIRNSRVNPSALDDDDIYNRRITRNDRIARVEDLDKIEARRLQGPDYDKVTPQD